MKVASLLVFFLAHFLLSQGQQSMTGVISASYPDGKPFTQPVAFTAYDVQRGLLFGAGNYGKIYTFNSTTLVLLSTFDLRASTFSTFTFGYISLPLGIYFREAGKRLIAPYTFGQGDASSGRAHTALLDASNPYNITILSALGFPDSLPTRYDSTLYEPSTDLFMRIAHPGSENSYLLELYTYKIINDTTFYYTRNRPPGDNYLYSGSIPQFGKRPAGQVLRPFYNGTVFFTFDRNSVYSIGQYGSGTFEAQIEEQATTGSLLDTEAFKQLRNPTGGSSTYLGSLTKDNPDPKDFELGLNSVYLLLRMDTFPSKGSFIAQTKEIDILSPVISVKSISLFANDSSFNTISTDERIDGTSTNVFFIATNTGRLFKFSFTDSGSGPLSVNTSPITSENIIAAGVTFTEQTIIRSEKRLILHSNTETPTDLPKLFSVPFADCGSRTSCDSCVAMNDPHCGWCVLDGKCSYKSSCSSAASTSGWLKSTCPAVSNYESDDPIHVGHSGSASFAVSNAPVASYSCSFKRENGDVVLQTATGSLSNLTCSIPSISTPLAKSTHEVLTLTLVPSGKTSVVASISNTMVVFNCAASLSCSECVNHPYDCVWSAEENLCVDASTTVSTQVASSEGSCPSLSPFNNAVIPENSTTTLAIQGSNLPVSGTSQYTCVFSTGDITSATRISSTSLTCESPLVFTDVSALRKVFVEVNYGSYDLPHSNDIVVTYYSCAFFGC